MPPVTMSHVCDKVRCQKEDENKLSLNQSWFLKCALHAFTPASRTRQIAIRRSPSASSHQPAASSPMPPTRSVRPWQPPAGNFFFLVEPAGTHRFTSHHFATANPAHQSIRSTITKYKLGNKAHQSIHDFCWTLRRAAGPQENVGWISWIHSLPIDMS